jgi:hypothetical protein
MPARVIGRYQIQPVIARLWCGKCLRREAGGVRGLSAQTEVDGYLRTLLRSPTLTHHKSPTQPDNTTGAVS